ncbi:hypothetical protein V6N11_071607 [Hibiscus sabdariffa]|uniref:Uncharacterized protein n=1 Tax=Hibiscus sabdariffa TaxID=183260 RepID=A0ABR2U0I9_9ROSI
MAIAQQGGDGYMGGAAKSCLVGQVSYMWSLLVLKQERKEYVIEEAVPNDPEATRGHGSIRDDSESQGDL